MRRVAKVRAAAGAGAAVAVLMVIGLWVLMVIGAWLLMVIGVWGLMVIGGRQVREERNAAFQAQLESIRRLRIKFIRLGFWVLGFGFRV
jgi:hypothetical protein